MTRRQRHVVATAVRLVLLPFVLPFDLLTWLGELSDRHVRTPVMSLSTALSNWEENRREVVVRIGQ